MSLIVFGTKAPGKLFRAFTAPFGCLTKVVVYLIGLLMILAVLLSARRNSPSNPPVPPAEVNESTESNGWILDEFPLLSQLDSNIYSPKTYADEIDPKEKVPIKGLTCLATVYVMLERGRGNASAMISPSVYNIETGAQNPGYVNGDIDFDGSVIVSEIKAGRPVILHGIGGPLEDHYMLVVGIQTAPEGGHVATVHDPWRGKRVLIDLAGKTSVHPSMPSLEITMMRLVDGDGDTRQRTFM